MAITQGLSVESNITLCDDESEYRLLVYASLAGEHQRSDDYLVTVETVYPHGRSHLNLYERYWLNVDTVESLILMGRYVDRIASLVGIPMRNGGTAVHVPIGQRRSYVLAGWEDDLGTL